MIKRRGVQPRAATGPRQAADGLDRAGDILRALAYTAVELLGTAPWPERIQGVLRRVGEATRVSRVYLFENHRAPDRSLLTSQRFEWVGPGIEPQICDPLLQNLPYRKAGFGRWEEILGRDEAIQGLIRHFPPSEQDLLTPQGIRSILVVPVHVDQRWWGLIGFDDCAVEREWSSAEVDALRTAAGILGAAVRARGMEDQLRGAHEELEERVRKRTGELFRLNESLRAEISERCRAEETLARQQQLLARSNADLESFAAAVSHDLQQPLLALIGFLRLHQQRYGGRTDAAADEYIGRALSSASHMQGLIRSLLEYSHMDAPSPLSQRVECRSALARALESLRGEVEESGAVVTQDPLPEVAADEVLLSQLFQNLLGNAMKFRSEVQPRIHVSAERRGGKWLFSVRDNGIGIPREHAERVFQIFQKCNPQAQHRGLGIGLALCKKIVERHGGRIYVESEEGQGSTFYFTLPADGGERVSPADKNG